MTIHVAYGIQIHTVAMGVGTAKMLSAIANQQVQTGTNAVNEVDAGSPYPQHVAINAQKPVATATTKDLRLALDTLGVEGLAITADGTHAGLDFWQILLDSETGRAASGSVHRRLNIHRGFAHPARLTCEHQGDATLDVQALAIYDPDAATAAAGEPIIPYAAVAAPTGLAGDERYTLHSVTVGGIAVDCNLRVEIDFGFQIQSEGCNSDIWDSSMIVQAIQPTITISGKNVGKFAASGAIPLVGAGGTHANTKIVLRRRLQTSAGFVADATAEHLLITTNGLAYWDTVHSASGNQRVENVLRITSTHDGTNTPLVADTAYAIP